MVRLKAGLGSRRKRTLTGVWHGRIARGKKGLGLNDIVTEHTTRVELYIDLGHGKQAENKAIFDQLLPKKAEVRRRLWRGARLAENG